MEYGLADDMEYQLVCKGWIYLTARHTSAVTACVSVRRQSGRCDGQGASSAGAQRAWRKAAHDWAACAILAVQSLVLACAISPHSRTLAAANRSMCAGSAP
jgi:hypothetical protein